MNSDEVVDSDGVVEFLGDLVEEIKSVRLWCYVRRAKLNCVLRPIPKAIR